MRADVDLGPLPDLHPPHRLQVEVMSPEVRQRDVGDPIIDPAPVVGITCQDAEELIAVLVLPNLQLDVPFEDREVGPKTDIDPLEHLIRHADASDHLR